MSEADLKAHIVRANTQKEALTKLTNTYAAMQMKIKAKIGEVDGKLMEIEQLKSKLSTDLEVAKVNKSVEGIGEIGDKLSAIMDTSNALASGSESMDLDALLDPTGETRIDEEFDKIMGN